MLKAIETRPLVTSVEIEHNPDRDGQFALVPRILPRVGASVLSDPPGHSMFAPQAILCIPPRALRTAVVQDPIRLPLLP